VTKQEISREDYSKLLPNDRDYDTATGTLKYYKRIKPEMTDEELNEHVLLNNNLFIEKIEKHLKTIKSIVIFWVILTIINIIGSIYLISEINKFIHNLLNVY
jgi:hypothetical protein